MYIYQEELTDCAESLHHVLLYPPRQAVLPPDNNNIPLPTVPRFSGYAIPTMQCNQIESL